MDRSYYNDTIENFKLSNTEEIIGKIAIKSRFADELTQKNAWREEIRILKGVLNNHFGSIYFEYTIPRMGQRIDVLIIIESVIFVLEFKIGEKDYQRNAIDQVWDYALDLKNFHETSHNKYIAPILIATDAKICDTIIAQTVNDDKVFEPIKCNSKLLGSVLESILKFNTGEETINKSEWEKGRYCPTPTIIEAAMALYNGHSVSEISRSDASAINLSGTSNAISQIVCKSKIEKQKSICFLTGVPGAGKTLVGLNIATTHINKSSDLYSVFLSGNGPLVKILCEALTRDRVLRSKEIGEKVRKGDAYSAVKLVIQNVHHFRENV